jgi:hypothetical protein
VKVFQRQEPRPLAGSGSLPTALAGRLSLQNKNRALPGFHIAHYTLCKGVATFGEVDLFTLQR